MAKKFMYIPNDDTQNTPSVDYNLWSKRLDTQLNKQTNQKKEIVKLYNSCFCRNMMLSSSSRTYSSIFLFLRFSPDKFRVRLPSYNSSWAHTVTIHPDRQTDRQINRQMDRDTDKQKVRQTDYIVRQTGTKQMYRQIDRQTDRQTNRQTDRQTDKQTNRQTDKQADRQIDRQADRQTDSERGDIQMFIPIFPKVLLPITFSYSLA